MTGYAGSVYRAGGSMVANDRLCWQCLQGWWQCGSQWQAVLAMSTGLLAVW